MKKSWMSLVLGGMFICGGLLMFGPGEVLAACNGAGGNNTGECGYRVPAGKSSITVNGETITRRGNTSYDEFIPSGASNAPVSQPMGIVFQAPPDLSWEYMVIDDWSLYPTCAPGLYYVSMNVLPVGSFWSL